MAREPLDCVYEHDHKAEPDLCEPEIPYWECPYLARWESRPGHDPHAVCAFGCWDEPKCVTCGPWDEEVSDVG